MSNTLWPPEREPPRDDRAATIGRLGVVAPSQPPDPSVYTAVLAALHSVDTDLTLEIRASATVVEVCLGCQVRRLPELERAILGTAPQWQTRPLAPPAPPRGHLRQVAALARPEAPLWAPLLDAGDLRDADPLHSILAAGQPFADEALLLRLLVRPAPPDWAAQAYRSLTQPAPPHRAIDLIPLLFDAGPRIPRFDFDPTLQRALERRLAQPAFAVMAVVAISGSDLARLRSRARSLTTVFNSRFDAGWGGLSVTSWTSHVGPETLPVAWRDGSPSLLLTAGELAALYHPASGQVLIPGVEHVRRVSLPLPAPVQRARGVLLGVHRQHGQDLPVHLPSAALRAGPLVTVGKTGVGKSTLDHQILGQAVAAPGRLGLAIIDPHGDLALDFALRSIPRGREDDVVLLELGDTDYPIGLPFFQAPPGVPLDTFIDNTFSVLRLIFREHWSPTRMEDAVYALTATLCRLPEATLLDAPRLLTDRSFRSRATAALDDPVALEFWGDFEQLSATGQRELARPVLYRLRRLYRASPIRNIVCQTEGLTDFLGLVDHGAMLLVSLAGPAIQAEADFLGELLIARLHLALSATLMRPPDARRPFVLAVDESHRFRGASLPILLREGRKLGLSPLLLSTQYLDAWGEELAESVLGNAGTLIVFRCGPTDSRRLAAAVKPFTPDDLENLDRHEAVVKLQIDGATMPAFDFRTLPITAAPNEQTLARIRAHTRARYARPRGAIEHQSSRGQHPRSPSWEGFSDEE